MKDMSVCVSSSDSSTAHCEKYYDQYNAENMFIIF